MAADDEVLVEGVQPIGKEVTLDVIHSAVLVLTNEVAILRSVVEPFSLRQRLAIIALSSFTGGVLTNLILWLLGLGTIFGLHR